VRKLILAAAAIAVATALVITGAATATSTGTEHFSFIDTSNHGSDVFSAIATGAFTGGGTATLAHHHPTIIRFPGGTITLKTKPKAGTAKMTTGPCLVNQSNSATYTITSGTGAYKGISGSGNTTIKLTLVEAMVNGKCSKSNASAVQAIATASGPVSLP